MSGGGYPKFKNNRGVPEICIGVKEFMCIGELIPTMPEVRLLPLIERFTTMLATPHLCRRGHLKRTGVVSMRTILLGMAFSRIYFF